MKKRKKEAKQKKREQSTERRLAKLIKSEKIKKCGSTRTK
jgi:hypothetical protein